MEGRANHRVRVRKLSGALALASPLRAARKYGSGSSCFGLAIDKNSSSDEDHCSWCDHYARNLCGGVRVGQEIGLLLLKVASKGIGIPAKSHFERQGPEVGKCMMSGMAVKKVNKSLWRRALLPAANPVFHAAAAGAAIVPADFGPALEGLC